MALSRLAVHLFTVLLWIKYFSSILMMGLHDLYLSIFICDTVQHYIDQYYLNLFFFSIFKIFLLFFCFYHGNWRYFRICPLFHQSITYLIVPLHGYSLK